mmetsp:Transcript_19930/g.43328  ORF Transcript_19930/g.43328 Transcript_19930/m.43328 type:complete len:210 (-) Transcript_19930:728-1357(-)
MNAGLVLGGVALLLVNRSGGVGETRGDEENISRIQVGFQEQIVPVHGFQNVKGQTIGPLSTRKDVRVGFLRGFGGCIDPPVLFAARLHHNHVLLVGVGRRRGPLPKGGNIQVDGVGRIGGVRNGQAGFGQLWNVGSKCVENDGSLFQCGLDVLVGHAGFLEGISLGNRDGRNGPSLAVVRRSPLGIQEIVVQCLFQILHGECFLKQYSR